MSTINCDSCADLREYAPEFVQNGVTSRVSTSLKNNTGLNPTLTTLHNNCDDLNDANDCLIGRMADEVEAYDVCDWKVFMKKHLANLYETLKAIIASMCGLWTKVVALCESVDNIFGLIRGASPKAHPGEWFETFYDKLEIYFGSASGPVQKDPHVYKPSFDADILSGAGCNIAKKLGRRMIDTYWTETPYPYTVSSITITQDLTIGEPIGIIRRSAVPASDISDARWKDVCRSGGVWPWYILNRNTLWYISARGYTIIDGAELNTDLQEYGEDNLVLFVHSFIGNSRSGGCSPFTNGGVISYDA